MSVIDRNTRAFIRQSQMIDPVIIDRVSDAYDALLNDDVEGYYRYMNIALAVQQGVPVSAELATGGRAAVKIPPVDPADRPTAVDKVKIIAITGLAERWGMNFHQARARVKEMLHG